jgi:glycosyltransferase involved in cell wall biosynthesis
MNSDRVPQRERGRRLRIAFVIGTLRCGGAEHQLIEIARNLDSRQFDPLVVTLRSSQADQEKGCRVVALSPPKGSAARLPWDGALMLRNMVRIAREFQPDLVHAFLPEYVTIFGAVAKTVSRARVLVANRLSERKVYRSSLLMGILERLALRHADMMVGNSTPIIEEICTKDGFAAERVKKIYNGIDTNRFRPGLSIDVRSRFGWSEQHFLVGMVANFRACKRHDDFLTAAALLHREHPDSRFVLVGNDLGTLGESRTRISQLGLNGVVQIITGCSQPETVYPALNVYVCTSETEGLSNVLLEAMACGRP